MVDYTGVLADLKAQRASLQQEQEELDSAIAAIERLQRRHVTVPGITAAKVAPNVSAPAKGAFAGMTMPQKIEAYFVALQRPVLTTRQVIEGLKAADVPDNGSLRGHVYNTLHRLSQIGGPFERHPDRRWTLRDRATEQGQRGIFSEGRTLS